MLAERKGIMEHEKQMETVYYCSKRAYIGIRRVLSRYASIGGGNHS